MAAAVRGAILLALVSLVVRLWAEYGGDSAHEVCALTRPLPSATASTAPATDSLALVSKLSLGSSNEGGGAVLQGVRLTRGMQRREQAFRAVVIGSTGETGRHVVRLLAANPQCESVTALVRRELDQDKVKERFGLEGESARKLRQVVVDFDHLSIEPFRGHQRAFCLLGTTRAAAGSAEAFRLVDYTYVLESAKFCKEAGVDHFTLMTAQGADASSSLLYPRTKGEVEIAVKELAFPRLSIFQPGLLLTGRQTSRPLEWVAQKLYPNFLMPASMKALPTEAVAEAMIINALRPATGPVEVVTTKDIYLCTKADPKK